MLTLRVYRPGPLRNGPWSFSDPEKGIVDEPFVRGSDRIIDLLVLPYLYDPQNGFLLLIDSTPFEGHTDRFMHLESVDGGETYAWDFSTDWPKSKRTPDAPAPQCWVSSEYGREGWLCPVFHRYFPVAPPYLYVRARNRPEVAEDSRRWEEKRGLVPR